MSAWINQLTNQKSLILHKLIHKLYPGTFISVNKWHIRICFLNVQESQQLLSRAETSAALYVLVCTVLHDVYYYALYYYTLCVQVHTVLHDVY